jgi:hypothetical protein
VHDPRRCGQPIPSAGPVNRGSRDSAETRCPSKLTACAKAPSRRRESVEGLGCREPVIQSRWFLGCRDSRRPLHEPRATPLAEPLSRSAVRDVSRATRR